MSLPTLHAITLMAYDAAQAIDAGGTGPPARGPMPRSSPPEPLSNGLSQCMQAMGADGYKQDFPIARHLACAKAAQYLDGTTEIQNVVISRGMRKHYGG